jgi:hypothetical protein
MSEQQQPAQEFFAVEANLLQAVVNYLAKRPWEEVSVALNALQQVKKIELTAPKKSPETQSGPASPDNKN